MQTPLPDPLKPETEPSEQRAAGALAQFFLQAWKIISADWMKTGTAISMVLLGLGIGLHEFLGGSMGMGRGVTPDQVIHIAEEAANKAVAASDDRTERRLDRIERKLDVVILYRGLGNLPGQGAYAQEVKP